MNRKLPTALALVGLALMSPLPVRAADDRSTQSNVREIIVVFKTHFDIGYTDLARNVVQKYRTAMMDRALDVVDRNRDLPRELQFVWTIPGWPMTKLLEDWPGQRPGERQRIVRAFEEGRFVVHGLPFTMHTELLEPEDLVRGLGYASLLSRQAHLPLPRDAKMTDVPSHSWILPTLLKHAGVDFLHLGCNSGSSSPDLPALFWWEGPDGSRLLTFYSSAGYGTGLTPPPGWPYRSWLALVHSGDNQGPPTPEAIRALLEEAGQRLPGVKVRIGRLSDFADSVLAESAEIPVVRGDMPDTWIHGPLSDPQGAIAARSVRPACGVAESLATQLRCWGVNTPEIRGNLAAAREQSLLYGEHTWGGSLSWVTGYGKDLKWSYGEAWIAERKSGRFQRLEESWAEHTYYIETAARIVRSSMETAMTDLARSVGSERERIVVFNPLPWNRNGIVHLKKSSTGPKALRPLNGGPAVPVDEKDGEICFWARDIPATGYRAFEPANTPAAEPGFTPIAHPESLENESLKVSLDPGRGGVRSLVEKSTGRELVDSEANLALGQLLYERFDAGQVARYVKAYVKSPADWAVVELGKPSMPSAAHTPYRASSPRDLDIHYERSAVAETATISSRQSEEVPFAVTTKVSLFRDAPYLDLELTVHAKPADDWPEAGWICLPVKIPAGAARFRLGRLGAVVDPACDLVRGSNRNLAAVNTGVAITDADGTGLAFCPIDSPLVSLDSPGIFKYDPGFVPRKAMAFVNLFNNQWSTNFRLWNEGSWSSRIRIWAARGIDQETALITPALEARYPLVAAWSNGPGGHLPPVQSGLELSRHGVLPCAFGPNPDGPGTILRLWEYAGWSGQCHVHLPASLKARSIQPVDLRGRPVGQALVVKDNSFTLDLRAYAPVSVLIDSPG
jgi:alpha-mannosidase